MIRTRNRYSPRRVLITLPIEFETDSTNVYFELDEVQINHTPERPMPVCSDPSNPAYADPGDPEEIEFEDIDEVKTRITEMFNEEIKLLKSKLEVVLDKLDETELHELLPKEEM